MTEEELGDTSSIESIEDESNSITSRAWEAAASDITTHDDVFVVIQHGKPVRMKTCVHCNIPQTTVDHARHIATCKCNPYAITREEYAATTKNDAALHTQLPPPLYRSTESNIHSPVYSSTGTHMSHGP